MSSAVQGFHENVVKLITKTEEPLDPVNYRGRHYKSDKKYVLLHEEEQHLADDIAFLAQRRSGPTSVSAVTVEQCLDPPSLIVRLAANETPTESAINGLRRTFDIVSESARAGTDRQAFKARLLDCIIDFSSARLRVRILACGTKKRKRSLHERIDELLESISRHKAAQASKSQLVIDNLRALKIPTKAYGESLGTHQTDMLRITVAQCFSISGTTALIESLETLLRSLGLPQEVYESRTVLEIDKIGRYYGICDSLIRLSRRREYCSIFSQFRLQVLTAPEPVQPLGARVPCRVHGEVQLVLCHERNHSPFPARAIGSSKSACFLCDLFIAKHGKFSISHTHKRLYEKWTWPQLGWMNEEQTNTFIEIVEAMNRDLVDLISAKKRKISVMGSAIESRAHILVLPNGAGIKSPTASHVTALPNISEETEGAVEVRSDIVLASTTSSARTVRRQRRLYAATDLPVEIDIDETIMSCTLVVGVVEYIFDTSRVDCGQVRVERAGAQTHSNLRIGVRDTELEAEMEVKAQAGQQIVAFSIHDQGEDELLVTISWEKGGCRNSFVGHDIVPNN